MPRPPGWLERGTISMYFLNATVDRETVRAFVGSPPAGALDTQVEAWIERDDGLKVGEGTASVGDPPEPSALLRRPLDRFNAGELRILQGVTPGDPFAEVEVAVTAEAQAARLDVITERLDWYEGESPWGLPVATPAAMVQMLYARSVETLRANMAGAVGLFGAIELRNLNGPVLVGRPYRVNGEVLAVGQSPKTEYMWFETTAAEPGSPPTAGMRMMLRWMKASSPLYGDVT